MLSPQTGHPDEAAQTAKNHPRLWRELITNPVSLGAIVTAYVTINTALFGYLSSKNAQDMEKARFDFQASLDEKKYETGLVLEVVKSTNGDQQAMLHRLCLLVNTGLIPQIAERMQHRQDLGCQPPPAKP
jgi:hypothetical protein